MSGNDHPLLSTSIADRRQTHLALAAMLASATLFAALAPFATLQLRPVSAFIPIYQSALVVSDLVTAVLLFGQFHILRSRALLLLAGGYLFTAFMAALHALTFPGLFAERGLLGAGMQSTAWMYMFWHTVFPLCVMGYVASRRLPSDAVRGRTGLAVLGCIAAALALAGVLTLLATAGQGLLPPIMQGNRYTPAMVFVVSAVWAFSLVALVMLWRQPTRSVLDLWLMVVMCAWLFDVALSAVLNAGRFDLGFYAGRVYGLLAGTFVLGVLLLENVAMYAQLAAGHDREKRRNAELQRLNDRLEHSNDLLADANFQLQRASRFKSEFLANMSHELRTPLNAIIGFSDLLKDGLVANAPDKQMQFAAHINESGHHLLELINEVLDLSKVEAGKMVLELEPVDPNAFLRSCLAIFGEASARQRIAIDFEPSPDRKRLAADPRKLRQVVYNLVSNALKFTPEGGKVRVSARRVTREDVRLPEPADGAMRLLPLPPGDSGHFLEVRVSDTGGGMCRDDLPLLFEAFQQVRVHDERRPTGTGLGLALVSRFASLHGGTVGVASAPGRGTTFAVWLPWRDAAEAGADASGPAPAVEPAPREATCAPAAQHALVIEDNQAAARLLKDHLEHAGFRVSCIGDGDELHRYTDPPPDVITLDILLPGTGGWDVLEQIKAYPALAAVPVVIVSVLAPDFERGFALGAAAVLQKPVTRRALLDALNAVARPAMKGQKVLVVDDDPAAVELVASSLEGSRHEVLRAHDGPTAIAIARDAPPDLMVLDLMMPGMSGFEVVEALRGYPPTASVPILVMTSKTVTPDERERLRGKVLEVVGKGTFDERRFRSELHSALHAP